MDEDDLLPAFSSSPPLAVVEPRRNGIPVQPEDPEGNDMPVNANRAEVRPTPIRLRTIA
jgi:hypothetical protein